MIRQHATRRLKSEKVAREPDGRVVRDADGSVVKDRVWESDWRAASFILERSHPKPWGRRESVEVSSADGLEVDQPVGAVTQPLTPARFESIAENFKNFQERSRHRGGDEVVEGEVVSESQNAG